MARRALVVLAMLLPTFAAAKYQPPDDPIAIAIVFNSQHSEGCIFDPGPDDPPQLQLHDHLRAALDGIDVGDIDLHFPAGSEVVIIGYDNGARVVAPFAPLEQLSGASIGAAAGDRKADRIGTDLVLGIETAISELARSPHARRVMIVIGDGNDTNNDLARTQLPTLAYEATKAGIRIHGLVYRSPISQEGNLMPLLTTDWQTITTLAAPLDELIRNLRHEPALLAPTKAPRETEVPWWWLGLGALIAAGALLLTCRSRSDETA